MQYSLRRISRWRMTETIAVHPDWSIDHPSITVLSGEGGEEAMISMPRALRSLRRH
jgi:hypothetical protein